MYHLYKLVCRYSLRVILCSLSALFLSSLLFYFLWLESLHQCGVRVVTFAIAQACR